jgi:hypothetical protein
MLPRNAVTTLLLAAVVLAGCGGSAGSTASTQAPRSGAAGGPRPAVHRRRPVRRSASAATASRGAASPGAASAAALSALPSPSLGALPQTTQLPPASSPTLTAEMQALWRSVLSDTLAPGMPAFFPLRAYEQVKAIADPSADYAARLVGDYKLDIDAAHQLLGSDPASATFVGVIVPASYAHWVPPGVCYNSIGYYEVPNSRLVYRQGGVEHSFGIASMISWRGVWFVVHLGAVVRSVAGGVVDDPAVGPGVPAPSSTC